MSIKRASERHLKALKNKPKKLAPVFPLSTTRKMTDILPPKKYTGALVQVTTRLPKDLLSKLATISKQTHRNRNQLIYELLAWAIDERERRLNTSQDDK